MRSEERGVTSEGVYLTTVPKVPKNPVAGFSKMAD